MKFLCLAYGDGKDWEALSQSERDELLAQDEVLRQRGAIMAAVEQKPTTVKAWDGRPDITHAAYAMSHVPLAGFSVIEAADVEEAIRLVKDTPCARAKGAIEIRPIMSLHLPSESA